MDGLDHLNHLIGSIYDAAVEPLRWEASLASINRRFDAQVTVMVAHRLGTGVPAVEWVSTMSAGGASSSSGSDAVCRLVINGLVSGSADKDTTPCLTHNADYFIWSGRDPGSPDDRAAEHHVLGMACDTLSGVTRWVTVQRAGDQRPFTDDDIAIARALIPHLRHALRLNALMPQGMLQFSLGRLVFEQMAEGALVADISRRLIHLNPAAEAILRQEDGISVRDGVVHASRAFENSLLSRHIGAAAAQNGTGASMLIRRPSGGASFNVFVAPLDREIALALGATEPMAILFIRDTEQHILRLTGRIREFFGFTPAESRLAIELLRGSSLKQAAETLERGLPTLRTQLKSAFKKTGAQTQSDLIRALLSVPTLL